MFNRFFFGLEVAFTSSLLALAALLACFQVALADPGQEASLNIDPSKPVVVSMGDSYSSGEGCPPFYGSRAADNESGGFHDWVAHRSEDGWPGRLAVGSNTPGGKTVLGDMKDTNWFFVACSGAESEHFYSRKQKRKFTKQSLMESLLIGEQPESCLLPEQDYIFQSISDTGEQVDYVTLTIGGNDIGFEKVMTSMVLYHIDPAGPWKTMRESWKRYYEGYERKDGKFEKPARETILDAYRDVREKAGDSATIVVAGYPKLLSEDGCCLWPSSYAAMLNEDVKRFNKELEGLVEQAAEIENEQTNGIVFVDVQPIFEDHGMGSDDPWINDIILLAQSEDLTRTPPSAYSAHPNNCGKTNCGHNGPDCGISAYAEAVQEAIDGIEEERLGENNDQLAGATEDARSAEGTDNQESTDHYFRLDLPKDILESVELQRPWTGALAAYPLGGPENGPMLFAINTSGIQQYGNLPAAARQRQYSLGWAGDGFTAYEVFLYVYYSDSSGENVHFSNTSANTALIERNYGMSVEDLVSCIKLRNVNPADIVEAKGDDFVSWKACEPSIARDDLAEY